MAPAKSGRPTDFLYSNEPPSALPASWSAGAWGSGDKPVRRARAMGATIIPPILRWLEGGPKTLSPRRRPAQRHSKVQASDARLAATLEVFELHGRDDNLANAFSFEPGHLLRSWRVVDRAPDFGREVEVPLLLRSVDAAVIGPGV